MLTRDAQNYCMMSKCHDVLLLCGHLSDACWEKRITQWSQKPWTPGGSQMPAKRMWSQRRVMPIHGVPAERSSHPNNEGSTCQQLQSAAAAHSPTSADNVAACAGTLNDQRLRPSPNDWIPPPPQLRNPERMRYAPPCTSLQCC